MNGSCDYALSEMGGGIAAALGAVDCVASQVTAQAFGRLFAPGGALGPVLVTLLTLYVAFFAISLIIGRSNLSIRSLIPRMITVGLVLTFATSWFAYQSVVWNLAIGAPDWLATRLTSSEGSATVVFAQKLDVVFQAVQQASADQTDFNAFSPPGMMWMGATMLLLGTVGVLVTARIALALLVALGPIFVVLALFNGTRGLFTGWLKGVVMLALTPLLAVLGGGVMLELAVPVLASLAPMPGQIDPQAAMAFFLVGAVHIALMAMVLKVAATMISGWHVFGLVQPSERSSDSDRRDAPRMIEARQIGVSANAPASAPRRVDIASATVRTPANDAGGVSSATQRVRVYATSHGDGQQVAAQSASGSRTRGIGNRFRSANSRTPEKIR